MKRLPPSDLDVPPPSFDGFTLESAHFLRALKRNNNREWFEAHRKDYEAYLHEPMIAFVAAIASEFVKHDIPAIANKKISLFRIYRDVRFSKNKDPYKTHIGLWLPVRGLEEESWTGFYFAMEPAKKGGGLDAFVGGGAHQPPSAQLKRVRAKIAREQAALEKIVASEEFNERFSDGVKGERLLRAPVGYAPDHPAIEWLRLKEFWVGRNIRPEELYSDELPAIVAETCAVALPFVQFIATA